MIKTYTLPMCGVVTNWESFSGEKGFVGPNEFARAAIDALNLGQGIEVPPEMSVTCYLLEIDVDAGIALVEVEAHASFHATFGQFLSGKSTDDVAAFYGQPVIRRGNNPRPGHELRYNQSRG